MIYMSIHGTYMHICLFGSYDVTTTCLPLFSCFGVLTTIWGQHSCTFWCESRHQVAIWAWEPSWIAKYGSSKGDSRLLHEWGWNCSAFTGSLRRKQVVCTCKVRGEQGRSTCSVQCFKLHIREQGLQVVASKDVRCHLPMRSSYCLVKITSTAF